MKIELTLAELSAILDREKKEKGLYSINACGGCKYEPCGALEEPCKSCARNCIDYYERENEE